MALSDPALATQSPLQAGEVAEASALVAEVGWNQIDADWRIFLEFGRVYAVRNSEGRVVATAATLPYEGRFAWISMVLVSGAYRRQGLATRLLRRCIDDLTAEKLIPVLDATPEGREVYRALGFQDSWGYHRMMLRATPATLREPDSDMDVRPIDDATWLALCDYDASAFGAARHGVLTKLRGRFPHAELCAMRDGKIAGLLLGRDGRTARHLGPLIAEDDTAAMALLRHAIAAAPAPLIIDFADAKGAVGDWLIAAGFSPMRPLTRMLYRTGERYDDPRRTYAVAGPELG